MIFRDEDMADSVKIGESKEKDRITEIIRNRITKKDIQMKLLSKEFSERDSLGSVWTKKNSAYATIHSEVAELSDLLRSISSNVQIANKDKARLND